MLAYTGSLPAVQKIVGELHAVLPKTLHEVSGREHEFLSILDKTPDTVEMVALYFTGDAIRPLCMHTKGFEIDGRRLYLLGSGRQAFFDYVVNTPDLIPGKDEPHGFAARAITMRFAAYAMMSQWATGEGLQDSWGGGFEVAFTEATGFKKVDNVLFRAWAISPEGELGSNGVNFLHHYEGPNLLLTRFSQFDDGRLEPSTALIPSFIQPDEITPSREEVVVEWTVDILVSEQIGGVAVAVQYDRPGSLSHAKFSFRDGNLVGWRIEKSRVDTLFEQFRISNEKRTPFIFRAI
jgi:hypothetical protein